MEQKKKIEILNNVLALINKCYQKETSLQEQYKNFETLKDFGALMIHEHKLLPKEKEEPKKED